MALVEPVFLDTTVLLGGYIDFGESFAPAQRIIDAVAEGALSTRAQPGIAVWNSIPFPPDYPPVIGFRHRIRPASFRKLFRFFAWSSFPAMPGCNFSKRPPVSG
jgi:hypothetical protein